MTTTDRIVVAVTGAYLVFAGWQLRTVGRDLGNVGLDSVWPWLFVAAGVACLAFALAPHYNLLAVAGSLSVAVCAGRALAILLLMTRLHSGRIPPRAPLAAATWAALAGLLAVLWFRVLRPIVGNR